MFFFGFFWGGLYSAEGGSLHGFIHGGGEGGGGEGSGGDGGRRGECSRPGRRLTYAETLRVAHDVAGAMAYLATQGVVHRDLKSHNVLLTSRVAGPRCLEDTNRHRREGWQGMDGGAAAAAVARVGGGLRALGGGLGLHLEEELRGKGGGGRGGGMVWAKVADFGIAKARGHTIMTTAGGGTNGGGAGGGGPGDTRGRGSSSLSPSTHAFCFFSLNTKTVYRTTRLIHE